MVEEKKKLENVLSDNLDLNSLSERMTISKNLGFNYFQKIGEVSKKEGFCKNQLLQMIGYSHLSNLNLSDLREDKDGLYHKAIKLVSEMNFDENNINNNNNNYRI